MASDGCCDWGTCKCHLWERVAYQVAMVFHPAHADMKLQVTAKRDGAIRFLGSLTYQIFSAKVQLNLCQMSEGMKY